MGSRYFPSGIEKHVATPEEVSHFDKYPGTYSLRGSDILPVPKVNTTLYGHSFSYLAAKNAFSDNYRTPVEFN